MLIVGRNSTQPTGFCADNPYQYKKSLKFKCFSIDILLGLKSSSNLNMQRSLCKVKTKLGNLRKKEFSNAVGTIII